MWIADRYGPSVSRLIAEADSGRVGDVRMVSIREHRFPFLKKVGDWNRLKRNTGDTLVEKCCHFFGEDNHAVSKDIPFFLPLVITKVSDFVK